MIRVSSLKFTAAIIVAAVICSGLVAGAMAQITPSIVTITEVESRNFPQVAAYVAVTDTNGPVAGLRAESIRVFEDKTEIGGGAVEVEPTSLENLRLVLALDTSVLDSELTQMQTAAKALVDGLSPKDRVTVIGFGDTVDVVRDFTNNSDELNRAIDSLTPNGEFTALHQMLSEATALVEATEAGRQAIIVITNARNNTGSLSVEASVAQAQALKIPVYVIGFGNRVQAAQPLARPVTATGGRYVTLLNAGQIGTALPEAIAFIRAGYKITFRSSLVADEQNHDLTIMINSEGGEAQAEGQFEARPGVVDITLAGLNEGQMVRGVVELRPDINTPGSVNSVDYLLDGEILATVTTPPYIFEWDSSTVAAGLHTLTVRTGDSVGNIGQLDLNLEVSPVLSISVATPEGAYEIGQPVPIEANIQTTVDLAKIELFINGILLESRTEPPYRFSFDSDQYEPGFYQIMLRAEDTAGQVSEDSVTLELLPKTVPLGWFERFISHPWVRLSGLLMAALVAIAGVLLLILVFLRLLDRWHRRRSWQTRQLEIFNMGNRECFYELNAKEPAKDLNFQFALKGQRLFEQIIYAEAQDEVIYGNGAAVSASVPRATPMQAGRVTIPPPQSSSASGSRVGQTLNKAGQAQYQAQGCIYTIAEFLDTLAIFLPGGLGNSIRGWSNRLYSGQMAVDQATRTPEQMARTAGHLKSQASSVVPTQARGHSATHTSTIEPQGVAYEAANTTPLEPIVAPPLTPQRVSKRKRERREIDRWSQTPLIEPEKSILLDLQIIPTNPYQKHSYNFAVVSKPVGQDETLAMRQTGAIDMPGVHWFWRYIPPVMVMLTGFGLVGGVVWLTFWRLGQMGILNL